MCILKNENKTAYKKLADLFYIRNENGVALTKSEKQRKEIIQLLKKVSEKTDQEMLELMQKRMSPQELSTTNDIMKAFYFGGVTFGQTLAEEVITQKNKIEMQLQEGKTFEDNDYFIVFLKQYSSYTPLLKNQFNQHLGGGYFCALGGYGLVIDPGHNFLSNFFNSGRTIEDINGVLVTHFHDDHYADLPATLALKYQQFSTYGKNEDKIDLLLDKTTGANFESLIKNGKYFNKKFILKADNKIALIKNRLEIIPLRTQHNVFGVNTGVGILITIHYIKKHVFITGDTGWNEKETYKYYNKIRSGLEYKDNIILVAHISSIYIDEFLSEIKPGESKFYKNHLCIKGVLNAIECLQPERIVLSEIGAELKEVIDTFAQMISKKYQSCIVGINDYKLIL